MRVAGGAGLVPSPPPAPPHPWGANLPSPPLLNRLSLVPLTSTSPHSRVSWHLRVCGWGWDPISLPLHLAWWTKGRGTIWSRQSGGGVPRGRGGRRSGDSESLRGLIASLYFTDLHLSPHRPNLRAGNRLGREDPGLITSGGVKHPGGGNSRLRSGTLRRYFEKRPGIVLASVIAGLQNLKGFFLSLLV